MVSIFAIMAMISSISGFFDMLGIAKGRTDLNFYNTVFRVIFTVPLIIIASMISIMAVAWSQLAFSIVGVCVFWYIVVTHTYHISVKTYLSQFARVLMVFSICGLFVAIIMESGVIAFIDNWIGNLLIYICAYIVILLLTAQRYLRDETKYVLQFINRKKIF